MPDMMLHFDLNREKSIRAAEVAMEQKTELFLVSQKNPATEKPNFEDIYEVGAILFALSLFIFALKHEYIGENSVWERLGKQYSLWIYIYHVIVMGILTLYEDNMGLRSMPWYPWCKPLVVFFLTLGLGVIWQKGRTFILKKKNK